MYSRPAALSGVHRFKETCQIASLTSPQLGTGAGVMSFQLNDLTNAASFKNLFDLYKITGVKVKLLPQFNVAEVGKNAAGAGFDLLPILYIAENRDPWVPPPTSVADIINDDGVKIIRGGSIRNMYLRNPKAKIIQTNPDGSQQIEFPIQFNSSSKALQPWLPTGGNLQVKDLSNAQHYGYRWFVDNTQCTTAVSWNVYATLYFSMKEQD